jgi:hypothetical protein
MCLLESSGIFLKDTQYKLPIYSTNLTVEQLIQKRTYKKKSNMILDVQFFVASTQITRHGMVYF